MLAEREPELSPLPPPAAACAQVFGSDRPEYASKYYRARYYDPKIGRFVSEDPIGLIGGDANLYGYVWNNAVNYTDPDGLSGVRRSCGSPPQAPSPEASLWSWFAYQLRYDAWESCMTMTPLQAALSLPGPIACVEAPIAGVITGYTRHGINSAISHAGGGTSPSVILETIRNPLQVVQQAGGTVKYIGPRAVVIINQQGKVVTTWTLTSAAARCPCK